MVPSVAAVFGCAENLATGVGSFLGTDWGHSMKPEVSLKLVKEDAFNSMFFCDRCLRRAEHAQVCRYC